MRAKDRKTARTRATPRAPQAPHQVLILFLAADQGRRFALRFARSGLPQWRPCLSRPKSGRALLGLQISDLVSIAVGTPKRALQPRETRRISPPRIQRP